MADILALLAALAFALGNVLQQKGTLEAPADEKDPHFLLRSSDSRCGWPGVGASWPGGCSRPSLWTKARS